MDIKSEYRKLLFVPDEKDEVEEKMEGAVEVKLPINSNNVVSGEKLRAVQDITLKNTKDFLSKTFGPMGSNTKIIKGVNQAEITSSYSKDGLKVLENIINSGPIEASIVDELISVTRAVEKEVGDGTTSTVILSSLIFSKLMEIEKKYNIPPFQMCRYFQNIVDEIKELIMEDCRECTIDDIYNISMISTNGNEEVSSIIRDIYKEFGMDVDLSVGISNSELSYTKIYDGLTITEGMSDPVFINNKADNTSEIHNAKVYHFADPVDTMDMISLFEAILRHNIYDPLENDEEPIPTVITCPRLSKDMSATIKMLTTHLYQFDSQGAASAKPPILIITDVVASDEIIMDDIANLCGCKTIKKYIDPKVYEKDVEAGTAPTIDTVADFAGEAELVVSDMKKTKFINPKHMLDKDGNPDPIYTAMVNFLKTEIEQEQGKETANSVGFLKKRLAALKSNMVDYLVGGVTIAERDMKKDLVEDAIKNCRSASLYGVGYAANFEGFKNSYIVASKRDGDNDIFEDIAKSIFTSYYEIAEILYGTISNDKELINENILKSLEDGYPFDISHGEFEDGKNVLCSIKLDVNILDTLSKIITMMATCNQCLLQGSNLNIYMEY